MPAQGSPKRVDRIPIAYQTQRIRKALIKVYFTAAVILTFALLLSDAHAHGGGYGALTLPVSYDRAAGTSGEGIDLNVVVLIFNLGFSFRHWNDNIIGWDNNKVRNEQSLFVGLGFGGLFQVQAGFSQAGTRMRIRSDIPLTGDEHLYDLPREHGHFVKTILLCPFIETDFDKSVYGISLGIAY